jgi:hypothetical protein
LDQKLLNPNGPVGNVKEMKCMVPDNVEAQMVLEEIKEANLAK